MSWLYHWVVLYVPSYQENYLLCLYKVLFCKCNRLWCLILESTVLMRSLTDVRMGSVDPGGTDAMEPISIPSHWDGKQHCWWDLPTTDNKNNNNRDNMMCCGGEAQAVNDRLLLQCQRYRDRSDNSSSRTA